MTVYVATIKGRGIAAFYAENSAVAFGIKPPLFDQRDIHVHVPEGATPKDGPSAGRDRSCLGG